MWKSSWREEVAYHSKSSKPESYVTLGDLINQIHRKVGYDNELGAQDEEEHFGIVDIMTFCDHPRYLNLPGNNFKLFLGQRVILKVFYMGTRGNEDVLLTDEDWNWLYERQLYTIIEKIKRKIDGVDPGKPHNFNFRELTLALGRRASKTIMASIIATYEAYKLIMIGDPYDFFNIPHDEEIGIINVSNSQKQSNRLFSQIKARIRNSPFFAGRIDGDPSADTIRVFTNQDLEKKDAGKVNIKVEGSIVLLCGHSNPDTLRGYSAAIIIFDELAFYDENPKISGKEFYGALTPSIAKFALKGEGRLVEISSCGPQHGIFYELYNQGNDDDVRFNRIVSYRLATWDINEELPYNCDFMVDERNKNPEKFAVEYGSMWATRGFMGNFFSPEQVDRAVKPFIQIQDRGVPGVEYFMHIDPAAKRDNYAVVIIERQRYIMPGGQKRYRCVLAYHDVWKPSASNTISFKEIDEEVLLLYKRFRPVSTTYDMWNSIQSVEFLKKRGVNAAQLPFNRSNKATFFQHLIDLLDRDELWLYYDEYIIGELINLKFKPTQRGISILADRGADVSTDDIVDCIAGACWMATGRMLTCSLPSSVIVNMGRV